MENQNRLSMAGKDVVDGVADLGDDKKVAQLERTVFILKRVVEKLQVENKRLVGGKRPLSERSVCLIATFYTFMDHYIKLKGNYLGLYTLRKKMRLKTKNLFIFVSGIDGQIASRLCPHERSVHGQPKAN